MFPVSLQPESDLSNVGMFRKCTEMRFLDFCLLLVEMYFFQVISPVKTNNSYCLKKYFVKFS